MINKLLQYFCIIYFISFLSACTAQIGPKSYLQSKNDSGIVIPLPMTDQNISHFYDLPQQTYPINTPSLQATL